MRRVEVIDTTLRDGVQAPGVWLSGARRVELAGLLASLGVDEIEAGTPAMGEEERGVIAGVLGLGLEPGCRVTGWCRADEGDLDAASSCGLSSVHVSVPSSERQLRAFGKDWGWVERTLVRVLRVARG